MPHIILETTADLPENSDIPQILEALVETLTRFETIQSQTIKAYHHLKSNWAMGEGAPAGFAHVEICILAGRTEEIKAKICAGMYETLCTHFGQSLRSEEASITLELREMDPQTYLGRKTPKN